MFKLSVEINKFLTSLNYFLCFLVQRHTKMISTVITAIVSQKKKLNQILIISAV